MIQQAVLYIESIIQAYGAWGVFIATMIEEVVAPIPSALVPMAAGFFLIPHDVALPAAFVSALLNIAIPVSVGVTIGSSLVYWIAYAGGKPAIDRFGKWLGLSWETVDRMHAKFSGGWRDEVTLFTLRLIPIVPGVGISGVCGIVRYRFTNFVLITFIATFIRATLLGLLGWQAGEFYHEYFELVERFESQVLMAVAILVGALVLWYLIKRMRRARST